jgi:hypothetical protein
MMSPLKQKIIDTLADIYDLAGDIRFGQLMCNLCAIVECQTNSHAWDVEDPDILKELEAHRADLENLVKLRASEAANR